MKHKYWTALFAALGMLVLILDTRTALEGASEGLSLCVRSVVPSLFPFFVLSILLTAALSGASIPLLQPISKACGIPKGAESVLIVGLLGGYPVGAQSVAQLYRDGQLTKEDAQRLLGFCSNAGPAFLFGIVAPQFSDPGTGWLLWGIHVASALAVGLLLPGKSQNNCTYRGSSLSLQAVLKQSILAIAQVCGWVILFRVLIAYLNYWILWLLPEDACILISGCLELTNGCLELTNIHSEGWRFLAASVLLSFGGICVCMQTASVTDELGLGLYPLGKLLQTLISATLTILVLKPGIWPPVCLAILGILCREMKNKGRNSAAVGV